MISPVVRATLAVDRVRMFFGRRVKVEQQACRDCDHTSVGMIVWQNGKILLIERKKAPFGFAPPAGHVDDRESYEAAALAELREEVGLIGKDIDLLTEGRRGNPCRRKDGTWHYWKIYRVSTQGKIRPSKSEVKSYVWCSLTNLRSLKKR